MTNIVTRKGLAFGALVALASTAIAGAPASAAGELNVVPSAGTSFTVSTTDTFNLVTTFAPGFTPSSYAQLKYQIVTDGVATIDAGVGTGAALSAAEVTAGPTLAPNSGTAHTTVISASRPLAGTGASSTPYNTNDAGAAVTSTTVNYLGLNVAGGTATTTTTSVAVTAFVDANNDGALSAGEWNTVKTVTFKKYSEITPTVVLGATNTGDTSVSATVNWGDLNLAQVAGEGVNFGYSHGSTPTVVAIASGTGATYSSSTDKWSLTTAGALASGTTAYAQAAIGSTLLGSAVSGTVTARTIATVTAEFPTTGDQKAISGTNYVRSNKAFSVKGLVKNGATPAVGVAGVAVVATVKSSATLSATAGAVKSVTVNGTTYTSNTAGAVFATVNLTSDANGYVTADLSSAGLADADTITVIFTAQNLDVTVITTQEADLTYTTTDASVAPIVATNKNTGVELTYNVKDQFGVLSAATNQRLSVAATNATTGSTQFVPVAAGVAKFTVTPATDSTADVVVTSTLDSSAYNSSTQNTTWTVGASTGITNTLKVRAAAYSISSAPAIDATRGINYGAWTAAGDQKQTITQVVMTDSTATGYEAPASSAAAGAIWAKVNLTGSNAGEKLTVSGSGVYLSIDGATPTADTATKVAQGTAVVVYVASNTVGTKTLTVTNGTVSATVDVKFASASAAEGTATTFAVAVVAAAQSGRAIDATVTVTDKWGNPVADFDATATVSGVALVNGAASANVTTDANGKATVKLSAGVNDLGDAVVTFSDRDGNTGSTNQPADVTAVAKTVTFGMTDGFIDVLNGKRASVTWSFAKGKRAAFYLDGVRKYNLVQPGDAEMNLQFNLKKGTHTIKLVIGGVTVDSITVKISK